MTAEANRKKYNKRSWIAETPFAHLKASLGLRQFLTRGIANVDSEWRWACTAFNLKKLMNLWDSVRGIRFEGVNRQ